MKPDLVKLIDLIKDFERYNYSKENVGHRPGASHRRVSMGKYVKYYLGANL